MTQNTAIKKPQEDHPGLRQSRAANPLMSHWVGASAGTGKTKVLIDRVLRLMLPRPGMEAKSATPPGRILCLTFTKTAAAEMSARVYEALSRWSVMEDAALDDALSNLTGEAPSDDMRAEARRLFARVLDTPGGLKIMTIHSFCQSVLKRFPVEAGVAPHFGMMDERAAMEYLEHCLHGLIADARRDLGGPLARAFDALALHLDAAGMSGLMAQVMSARGVLGEILDHHGSAENAIDAVYDYVHAEKGQTEEGIAAEVGDIRPEHEAELRRALTALLQSGVQDQKKAAQIQPWLEAPAQRGALLPEYRRAFLTADGAPYKKPANKAAVEAYPDILRVMTEEAERLVEFDMRMQAQRLADVNAALLTVSAEMMGRYARHKRLLEQLDFDDLILKTAALLSDGAAVQWVLYKLDEGIDHILVDEAQDTSPAQWRVVQALSAEFFAGDSGHDTVRTLFVVGDEKQSIFSFQGADPAAFARMNAFFGEKALAVQEGWEIFLEHSFRSTRAVLGLVDDVFAGEGARRGVVSDVQRQIRHLAFRAQAGGTVELWPLARIEKPEEGAAWQAPVEITGAGDAKALLAAKIAETISGWLESGETLASKNRALRAGDILILVQSRGAFVDLLMRALKEKNVPVAGIDRMSLGEEICVMDLIAAAQFGLQPDDDLTLATLLKSPLVGMTEEDLYPLCHARPGTLWPELRRKHQDIAAALKKWIESASVATPYEFFAALLNTPCPADAVSGRRAFYGRLGFDIHDALDEFLNACLHYEQSHAPSVQSFVDWFLKGEAEVKREQAEGGQNLVRIMTAHGSKGLQAPIVFLPDTVKKLHDHNKGRVRMVWPEGEGGVPLWSPRAEFDAPVFASLRDVARERQEEEYRRLLYVALTRAEDRLIVCGWRGVREPKDDCWYNLVAAAFPEGAKETPFTLNGAVQEENIRLLSCPQEGPPEKDKKTHTAQEAVREPLPAFAHQSAPEEESPPRPLAPSRPGEDEPAAKGPLDDDGAWKFRRGVLVHQLLEILPQLPQEKWMPTLDAYLAPRVPDADRAAFTAEILAVLRHPDFARIFGLGSLAEVPVVGLGGATHVVAGQIDRLLVTEDEVLVVDYKTNRPPPRDEAGVPPVYLKQMAAYRAVLKQIYGGRPVRCALLWTDGPFLMPLSAESLDSHAP